MKIVFEKHVYGSLMVIYPRVSRTEQEPDPTVSLARRGVGCEFKSGNFDLHDSHSPAWQTDGKAPMTSSAPELTADLYMARIVDALKAAGATIDAVEVTVVEHKFGDSGGDSNDDDGPKGAPPKNWDPYLN